MGTLDYRARGFILKLVAITFLQPVEASFALIHDRWKETEL